MVDGDEANFFIDPYGDEEDDVYTPLMDEFGNLIDEEDIPEEVGEVEDDVEDITDENEEENE